MPTTPTLYEQIGPAFIEQAITLFYERAFTDGIIGHFFFAKDRAAITRLQIDFATGALGGPRRYRGKPLRAAHAQLAIRLPHFRRRQRLMAEVLEELGLPAPLAAGWLAIEEQLAGIVMGEGDGRHR